MTNPRLLGLVLVAAWATNTATATTLYVDAACGDDTWTGLSPDCVAPDGPLYSIGLAISRSSNGDEIVVADGTYPGGLSFNGKQITLRSANGPDHCTIDGHAFDFEQGETTSTVVQGFTMTNGTGDAGGAVHMEESGGSFIDCVFTGNTAERAGALFHIGAGDLVLDRCRFHGNSASIAVGAVFSTGSGAMSVSDCVFSDNAGVDGPALICGTSSTQVVNCTFTGNTGAFLSGALLVAESSDGGNVGAVTNCIFSRNTGQRGAAYVQATIDLSNCSFSGNLLSSGLAYNHGDTLTVSNSVFWGNTPAQIAPDLSYPDSRQPTVSFSDVGGGWSGPGGDNIDADPLFVQAGTDDLRLAGGSPCIDAGSNDHVAADTLDLDGDGDTAESVPFDLGGDQRIQSGTVDMGAWEGAHAAGDPAASDNDFDGGEFVVLVPVGEPFNPVLNPAVIASNTSEQDNATFLVTQIDWELHPGAGGYSEMSSILQTETTLDDGQFTASLFISFELNADDFNKGGVDPRDIVLTWFDPAAESWAPAVSGNTGPEGDWHYSENPADWGNNTQLGDWGAYWNPGTLQGFAWANVDHASDFAIGLQLDCAGDCGATADGVIGIDDLLALLAGWGPVTPGGPCDVDGDGAVGIADLTQMLLDWGPCVSGTPAQPGDGASIAGAAVAPVAMSTGRSADLDGDGRVGRGDLESLKASWGRGAGSRELLDILARWGNEPGRVSR